MDSTDWLDIEEKGLESQQAVNIVRLPSPKFEENKITTLVINAVTQWKEWTDPNTSKVKAIIPCTQNDIACNFWLNKKNPTYKDLVHKCREASDKSKVVVKILPTGQGETRRYVLPTE